MNIKRLLEENPIIAAVKDIKQLKEALTSQAKVIFVLFGDIININEISDIIGRHNKAGIIHVDLVEGLSNKEVSLKYIKESTSFKGIISTKPQMIKYAKNYGLFAIQRVFVFDTISLGNAKKHFLKECDAIEVLPGVVPKVIEELSSVCKIPVVAGGLIDTKEEVMLALRSNATCVSTSKKDIWEM